MAYIPRRYGIPEIADLPGPSKLNPTEIEFALRDLVAKPYEAQTFAFDLIGILNASKMTIGRLRSGATNKAKRPGDLLWQSRLFFRQVEPGEDVGDAADAMAADPLAAKNKARFIVATDGKLVHIRDTKFDETEIVEFGRLDEKSDFLLPLAGYERRAVVEEHPADIKAAKKLKKLYDAILAANPTWSSGHHMHELNLLMTRLLFCFYAEKTGIFATPDVFTDALTQHTYQDPGAVAPLLDRLFRVMNVEEKARPAGKASVDARFPYVNGSLFGETVEIPTFDLTARRQLLECGDLDWTEINPDIFGSMIQTIAQNGTRSDLGMHYTSVPNIMKVLQPLFLDELNEAYEKAKDSPKQLDALLARLSKIRVFDPACGSGNFLVIAYKALRELETRTLVRIAELQPNTPLRLSGISLENFYGMDVVDFACETTKLSLWIAEHQTNSAFQRIFGMARPVLPLAKITTVRCVNATREDWLSVCPPREDGETFVCGNPPYLGAKNQSKGQRADVVSVFGSIMNGDTNVDYVGCWFVKLTDYIAATRHTTGALVATNSVVQGEQVSFLWPYVFSRGLVILFAHTSFKWANSASHNAGVTCVIVGIGFSSNRPRRIFTDTYEAVAPSITAYLVPGRQDLIVHSTSDTLNGFPEAVAGSQPKDGGNLLFTAAERARLLQLHPEARALIRPFFSAEDVLYGSERFTLWISDEQLPLAQGIPEIRQRLEKTRKNREEGGQDKKRVAETPHRYARNAHKELEAIVIPGVSSERRLYLQIDLVAPSAIVTHALIVAYSPPPYLFALLSSRMHRVWAHTVGGKLEDRLRYSSNVVYNTFPVPTLSDEQQRTLADYSRRIIKTRGMHPGKSLAWLYNPETMPDDLLAVHKELDEYLESSIYGNMFKDDNQRLERLFSMYARLRERAERNGTLFANAGKERG
jgi:hypothetical protein